MVFDCPPSMLMQCIVLEELVFTYNRAAYHPAVYQPCSVSPACHHCPELELKGAKPRRRGLLLEEGWAGGGVWRVVF